MELAELNNNTDQMIENFVNNLGLDGKAYVEATECLMTFGNIGVPGQFLSAESPALKNLLDKSKLSDNKKNFVLNEGLILINKDYKYMPADEDLIITCIHEKFHANRMLLAHIEKSSKNDINPIFYDNGRFVANNTELIDKYIDPSQDILLESIDTSNMNVKHYEDLSDDEKDDLYFANDNYGDKLEKQYQIDEALVEIMAIVSFQLSTNKFNDIMDIIRDINDRYEGDDIHSMTNIILRHNDLELFKWMIDPLTYQNDDVHYDFFSHYVTDEDQEDVNDLYESTEIMPDDDEIDRIATEISQSRMR